MKKYKFILTIVLVIFLITSCNVPSETPKETVNDVENAVVESKPIESSDPVSTVGPVQPSLLFSSVDDVINENYLIYTEHYELIDNLKSTKIKTHINQSIKSVINKLKNNTLQIERSLYDESSEAPLQMEVTGNPIYFNDQLLSYEIISKTKTVNDTESVDYTFLNYDLKSGQTIKLKELLSLDQLYTQIEKIYPKSFEAPFNKDMIELYNLNQSFHFSDDNSAVFVIHPYELNTEQEQPITVPLSDINYDSSRKKVIGTAIIDTERIEDTNYYEVFFSYPHFNGSDEYYSEINQTVEQHAKELYDYGTNMAILDHGPLETQTIEPSDGIVDSPDLDSNEASSDGNISNLDQNESNDLNSAAFDLPTYWFNLSYKIYTNNEKILSFGLYDYQYTGGAHGLSSGTFYSYDLELGKQIEIKDLFEPKFDYITYINDRIYREIDQETKKNPESKYAYYDFSGIDEHVKFYIEDNELVIFFDEYEIASYAAGTPTFRIPLP